MVESHGICVQLVACSRKSSRFSHASAHVSISFLLRLNRLFLPEKRFRKPPDILTQSLGSNGTGRSPFPRRAAPVTAMGGSRGQGGPSPETAVDPLQAYGAHHLLGGALVSMPQALTVSWRQIYGALPGGFISTLTMPLKQGVIYGW